MTGTRMVEEVQMLLQEGNAALLAGDAIEARQRFRRVLELEPDNVEALIGLAGSVRPYREKRDYLQRALELNPTSAEARASLAFVEAKMAAGEVLAPRGVQLREPTLLELPPEQIDAPLEPAVDTLFCYNHPDRETGLQCTNCTRPICHECVRPAPVGQLCPECARARRPRNYQVSAGELAIAGVVTLIASLIVSVLGMFVLRGFFAFFIAFIVAPLLGELIVRMLDRLTHAKRGKEMQIAVGIGMGLGAAPLLLLVLAGGGFAVLPTLLFLGLATATVVARLR